MVLTLRRIFRLLNLLQQVGGTPFPPPPPLFFLLLNLSEQLTALQGMLQKNCFIGHVFWNEASGK